MSNTTTIIELPVLTRENYDECRRTFWDRPVSDELVEQLRLSELPPLRLSAKTVAYEYLRHDYTENGEPTTWTVYLKDDGPAHQDLSHTFYCDVPWCDETHDIGEADTYDEMRHYAKGEFTGSTMNGGCDIYRNRDGFGLYTFLDMAEDRQLTNAADILDDLAAFSDLVRAQSARARALEVDA